ncbi:MAG: aminoglycoside phosphotransferase family protein [Methylococcaceae bacterium]|nr:aminoglycoside phosphotransferase family protein [Methylococcaceae bacterium]
MDTVTKPCSSLALFSFLGYSHPFFAQIRDFEQRIRQSNAYAIMKSLQAQGLTTSVHAEIKSVLYENRRLLDRFYYSIQFPNPELPGGWYGWSLHYTRQDGVPKEYEFPHDPKLAHLARFIDAPENREIKVLRYVPLRRVTFIRPGRNLSPDLIGKLKKPNRAQEGYRRLTDISAICSGSDVTVPSPVSLDSDQAIFYQTLVPGEEVTHLLNDENYRKLMADIGNLHGELGKWPIPGDKRWDRGGIKKNLSMDLDEIVFYLPENTDFINKIGQWIKERQNKVVTVAETFCHGDFACSQILRHDSGWSVVDFDLAGMGDPYQDMAMFITSLSHDVPLFQDRPELLATATQDYLKCYQQSTEKLIDTDSFIWYRVCAEIYYLALILKKDRFTPLAYQQAHDRMCKLTQI